jgi:hypothetical protein
MKACPHCTKRMVCRDDSRDVCLACGWSRDDTIEEELAQITTTGTLPLHVGPPVATHRAYEHEKATWHSGSGEAWDHDDGYRYGFHGERHSRKLTDGQP